MECNTAYGGDRSSTAYHRQLAEDHGYTKITEVDIMDADGSVSLPVESGRRITENYVGAHFVDYDFCAVLSHFKGHAWQDLVEPLKIFPLELYLRIYLYKRRNL